MLKRWILLLLCFGIVASLSACGSTDQPAESTDENKLHVSVTFNAMKEFAEAVGQDMVIVTAIIPDGTEAHGFEPKAQDLICLSTAEVFVYSGLGMEAWAEEAAQAASNDSLIVVDASEGADLITQDTTAEHDHDDAEHDENEEHGHSHGLYDPHIWLGLKGAQTQVQNIKDALIKADPDHKAYYEKNCDHFTSQLESLYQDYLAKFQTIEKRSFVTGHAAFGYLCRDFGLVQNSVRDVYAEGEPSAQQLAALVEYCRDHDVKTIFAEEMASPAVSSTLANEVGAEVQTIYTMETSEDGKSYLERMEVNLSRIYGSLTK